MGNGRIISDCPDALNVALLDAQSASASGPWVEVDGKFNHWSFTIKNGDTFEEGATDATVDIMVSNDESKPAASSDGTIALTLSLSSTAGSIASGSYKYVKAKKTAGTTPVAVTIYGRFQ